MTHCRTFRWTLGVGAAVTLALGLAGAAGAERTPNAAGSAAGDANGDQAPFPQPHADALDLAVQLRAGAGYVEAGGGRAHPLPFDWTGDGTYDLLVGQFSAGKLRLYRNAGTNAAPRFDRYEYVQAGGVDATVPAG